MTSFFVYIGNNKPISPQTGGASESMSHRHLSNIDYLKVRTACLVYFISTVNGHRKKEEKEALKDRR